MPRHRPVTHVDQLQRGDHVRVLRSLYEHHAIYAGDHQLIEFDGGVIEPPKQYEGTATGNNLYADFPGMSDEDRERNLLR